MIFKQSVYKSSHSGCTKKTSNVNGWKQEPVV